MRSFEYLVGVSPPIVDEHHFFASQAGWLAVCRAFGLGDGVDYVEVPALDKAKLALLEQNVVSTNFKAGSSILAALTALPARVKAASIICTTSAMDASTEQPASLLFRQSATAYGLQVIATPIEGVAPVAHILVEPEEGMRCFVKEAGLSKDLWVGGGLSIEQPSGLWLVDAYELNGGRTEATLTDIIHSARGRLAMSLGSVAILTGVVRDKILAFDARDEIGAIFGNVGEYSALLGIDTAIDSAETLLDVAAGKLHADLYMTDGAWGIYALVDSQKYFQPAVYLEREKVVSTSGAGDAAIGVILGAIALGRPTQVVLQLAVEHCAQVVQSQEDILVPDW